MKEHNADTTQTWKKGLNQFSDLTKEEFIKKYLSSDLNFKVEEFQQSNMPLNGFYLKENQFTSLDVKTPATKIDWRESCGPKIWNQASGGCCYAFALLNVIECNYNITQGKYVELSRQQIIDCNPLTLGCRGGSALGVGVYAKSVGLVTDKEYPFVATNQTCKYNNDIKANIYMDGIERFASNSPFQANPFYNWQNVYDILSRGALYTGIDASNLKDYRSGILIPKNCTASNHAILLIGYDVDLKVGPFWLLKNSWSTTWGEPGYFKIASLLLKTQRTIASFTTMLLDRSKNKYIYFMKFIYLLTRYCLEVAVITPIGSCFISDKVEITIHSPTRSHISSNLSNIRLQ